LKLVIKIDAIEIFNKTVSTGENTIVLTDEELDKLYRLYGSSNSLTATFILTTADKYTSEKTCTITLTGNQKTGYVGADKPKRVKVWVGVNGSVKTAVIWVGNNGRKRCI